MAAVLAVLVALAVVGCAATDQATGSGRTAGGPGGATSGASTSAPARSPSTSAPATSPSTAARLTAVTPCPASIAGVAAVAGGLPDLTLPCLDPGSGPATVRLAGVRGRPLVLNLWATWCSYCRAELPVFADAARVAGARVRFLGLDPEDDPAGARDFASAAGVPYNSVVDSDGATRAALHWTGGLPVTVFYSADGHEVGHHIGPVGSRRELDALIRRYLGVDLR